MIKNETIDIKIHTKNKNDYPQYKIGDIVTINIDKLPKQSHIKIIAICDVCGNDKELEYFRYNDNINSNNIFACSKKCANIKRELTNNIKYGCDNIFQNEDIKKSIKISNLKKFGVTNLNKLDIQKQKIKQTKLEKYGNEKYVNIEKAKQTKLEKYGDEKYINIKKAKQTKLEKYGDEKYVNIDKKNNTCLKIYGNTNYMFSNIYQENRKKYILTKYNLILIENNYPNYKLYCDKCKENYDININVLYKRIEYKTILCTKCNPVNIQNSGYESLILDFIKNNYNDKILTNVRYIISPLELDIYLPDLKLAFEFNGVYWHNELNKEKNYHLNKTELCEKQGIQLIHIYEDDWIYKQDIIKSMILNKLGKTENKFFARKCEIKEITDNKLIRSFLDENHIQGFVGSKVKIGLFYNNELISLMTFGDRRVAMGKKSTNIGEFELLRFCNKLNTNVIGGASRLFKYFIKTYNPTEITTYADRSFSQGKLYETLGFNFIGKTEPNYYYVVDGIRKHRFNYRKDKLIKDGFDPNKTEHQIMLDRKIYRIFDSGNLKFILQFNF
jgi:hypothetical protein